FLMATSAIGPGFLTQTAAFTEKLAASFAFVILVSVLLDIGAQLNIWRLLTFTGKRAQELANDLMPGLGYLLSALVVMGGLVFNIGNIAGCGLGLNVLTGMKVEYAAALSCGISMLLFLMKDAAKAMDVFVKLLGLVMIVLTGWIALRSGPPVAEALYRSIIPARIDPVAIITLVGGTVGGYISFAGAHRLIDAGLKGSAALPQVNRSAVSGILITGLMRAILFLAALGVVHQGFPLDTGNPAASVFQLAAGNTGYRFFGLVMWCAAITSVVGASYTSLSFLRSFHPAIENNQRLLTATFILMATVLFIAVGRPRELLITAGTVNGFILPVALAIVLVAMRKQIRAAAFHNPPLLTIAGWVVVAALAVMAVITLL
ncbi:MAG TPA: NRAMP family divalent metal transporter, partial [Chitinophagaceae bacterium]